MKSENWLEGSWKAGWALDLHTIRYNSISKLRTKLGEMVYQYKYKGNKTALAPIIEEASRFLKTRKVLPYLKAIIPVPLSNEGRDYQPVYEIAEIIGKKLGKAVDLTYLTKIKRTPQVKNLRSFDDKFRYLKDAFNVADERYKDKKVLLFDDIYQTGATLTAITDIMKKVGKVQNVYVLALTKTRSQ